MFVGDFSSLIIRVVSFLMGGGSVFFFVSGFLISFLDFGLIGIIFAISSSSRLSSLGSLSLAPVSSPSSSPFVNSMSFLLFSNSASISATFS